MSKQKTKGKGLENLVAEKIHETLLKKFPQYKELLILNPDLKVKRDSFSGAVDSCDGDINLGLGKSFFPYSVECKKIDALGELSIKQLTNSKMPLKTTYILQCIPKANQKNLKPILVFQGNRTPIYAFFENERIQNNNLDKFSILFKINSYYICLFEEFLDDF